MNEVITFKADGSFTQANELIRATRNMSEISHRLYFFFLAKREKGQKRIETTVSEVRKALNLPKSGQQNRTIINALKELERDTIVSVQIPIYRSPRYQEFIQLGFLENEDIIQSQPIIKATLGKNSKKIIFDINPLFIPLLDDLNRCYSWAYLENIAKLKGKYSYRIYEWIESKIGKRENFGFTWVFDSEKDNEGLGLRQFLGIRPSEYKLPADLKRRVIEPALKEINEKLKFSITWDYLTKGSKDQIYALSIFVERKDSEGYLRELFYDLQAQGKISQQMSFDMIAFYYEIAGRPMPFDEYILSECLEENRIEKSRA